jgi:Big-like domain-containing protein
MRLHYRHQTPSVFRIPRAVAAVVLALAGACEHGATTTAPRGVATIQLSLDVPTIGIGEHTRASATALDAAGGFLPEARIEWRSSRPDVATVDGNGTVTGVSAGTATITASSNGVTGALPLVVVATLPNVKIEYAYLSQVVQRVSGTVPLIAGGNPVLVRVFGRWDRPFPAGSARPRVRVELFHDATLVAVDESDLTGFVSTSTTAIHEVVMPASVVQPGLRFRVTINPDSIPAEQTLSDNVFPGPGATHAVDVRVMQPFKLHFLPLILPLFLDGDITTQNLETVLTTVRQVLPVGPIDATIGSQTALQWKGGLDDVGAMSFVLAQIDLIRMLEGSKSYYVGVAGIGTGFTGIGYLGSTPLDFGPSTHDVMIRGPNAPLAHELGHNMGRKHTPCGNPLDPDLNYPYPGGSDGESGADLYTWSINGTFPAEKPGATTFDLMGYCAPRWISDFTYEALLRWRITEDSASLALGDEASEECLIVWGAVTGESIRLEPSFVVKTRPVLPRRSGAYTVSGTTARGAPLFSLSFDPAALDQGDERHFMFAIPLPAAQRAALTRVAVAGERRSSERVRVAASLSVSARVAAAAPRFALASSGRATITWDTTAAPMVIVREPGTGRVLGIGESGQLTLSTSATAVEVLMSDGVGSVLTTVTRR